MQRARFWLIFGGLSLSWQGALAEANPAPKPTGKSTSPDAAETELDLRQERGTVAAVQTLLSIFNKSPWSDNNSRYANLEEEYFGHERRGLGEIGQFPRAAEVRLGMLVTRTDREEVSLFGGFGVLQSQRQKDYASGSLTLERRAYYLLGAVRIDMSAADALYWQSLSPLWRINIDCTYAVPLAGKVSLKSKTGQRSYSESYSLIELERTSVGAGMLRRTDSGLGAGVLLSAYQSGIVVFQFNLEYQWGRSRHGA